MIMVELTGAVDALGTTQVFYLSDDPFVTTPSDTPANTEFRNALVNPGSLGTSVFGDGRTGGGATIQVGEIQVANLDGEFDAWKDYSFSGRDITIRTGDPSTGYPGTSTIIFKGTVEAVELTWDTVVIRMMDKQRSLQVPLLPNSYGGTNALPNGVDGAANDIKGQKKPRVYGTVYNVQPQFVNTSLLIYQLSDRAVTSISAVYDRGVALTAGADYATNALLQAAAGLTAGNYYTCKAEGLFRLGSAPAGYPTADASSGASASARTPAQILKLMAQDAGYTVNAADVTAMDALTQTTGTPWECGIYVTDDVTFEDAMNQIAQSVGAVYYFDAVSQYRMGVISAPAGAPVLYVDEDLTLPGIERLTPVEMSTPPWAVTLQYGKVYTVQDTDLAGAVSNTRRAFLADEFRRSRVEDSSVKLKHLLAEELTQTSLLIAEAPAAVESARRLALFSIAPEMYQVPVPLDIIQGTSVKLLDVISFTMDRFDLEAGKSFLLLGLDLELADSKAVLLLWG